MTDDLKNERIVIGIRQSMKAIVSGEVKYLIVAQDAETKVLDGILTEASNRNIELKNAPSMISLGKTAGIDVGSAVIAVLN